MKRTCPRPLRLHVAFLALLVFAPALFAQTTAVEVFSLDPSRKIEIRNVGPEVNSAGEEYVPCLTAEGTTLYFVRGTRGPGDAVDHDLWMTLKPFADDVLFAPAKRVEGSINSKANEGAMTISADGRLIVLTACPIDGVGDCELYEIRPDSLGGMFVRNLSELNSPFWESAASLSADGRTLYFVSNRPVNGKDTKGDIYVSERDAKGTWGAPRRLPDVINTAKREYAPCLAPGDSVLFFASDRSGGEGGLDFYYTKRIAGGGWSEPVNLGAPFNTSKDEMSLAVTADGMVFYLASKRTDLEHFGGVDLYLLRVLTETE